MAIERIEDASAGIGAVKAVGKVEAADNDGVLTPAIDAAVAEHGKVRLVYLLGSKFDSHAAGASWEGMKLGAGHITKFERVAVVTDHRLMADAVRAFGLLMPGDVKAFPVSDLDSAMTWAAG
jgi:hypothetical protein